MYIASFLTFMSIGGFPSYVEDMKVSFFVFFRWSSLHIQTYFISLSSKFSVEMNIIILFFFHIIPGFRA